MTESHDLYALIVAVRRAFNALKATGDALHADVGVTAAMRAVMETLADKGPQAVPQIARAKDVSRQHIQILADQLTEAGLARFRPNPAHKRSDLLALTDKGAKLFADMRKREAPALASVARRFATADVRAATRVLHDLTVHLEKKGPSP